MSVLYDVKRISKTLGDKNVLRNISFSVNSGERFMIFGPSGCGKTTLLRCLNRMIDVDHGSISFQNKDLKDLDPTDLRRQAGLVFQRPAVIDGTVRDNVSLGLTIHGLEDRGEVKQALKDVGLPLNYLNKDATKLSGGEVQRMAIARTLVLGPKVLLLDEPTSALDQKASRKVEGTLMDLSKIKGVSLIWVTHSRAQAVRVGERLLLMEKGRAKGIGSPSKLLKGGDE